jgi:hypothetical protein
MSDIPELDCEISDDEYRAMLDQAFALTGIDPDDMRVSCDPYGVPASYLATAIIARSEP